MTFAVLPGQLFIDVDDWVITFKLVVIHEDIPLETLAALQGETVQITLGSADIGKAKRKRDQAISP